MKKLVFATLVATMAAGAAVADVSHFFDNPNKYQSGYRNAAAVAFQGLLHGVDKRKVEAAKKRSDLLLIAKTRSYPSRIQYQHFEGKPRDLSTITYAIHEADSTDRPWKAAAKIVGLEWFNSNKWHKDNYIHYYYDNNYAKLKALTVTEKLPSIKGSCSGAEKALTLLAIGFGGGGGQDICHN